MNQLIQRLNRKKSDLAIPDLGSVGLPPMLRNAKIGHRVLGPDLTQRRSSNSMPASD